MRIVVVGSGGREHALALALATHHDVAVTPGNAGIPGSVSTPPEELEADLFVVGPEIPLVDGLADRLRAQGKRVFGPGADGAQLEGSKSWMKELLTEANVPTASYGVFTEVEPALNFLKNLPGGYVIKTDGLAAGKGVLVANNLEEAIADVKAKLSGEAFGEAGQEIVIEEALDGYELSVFAVCDGSKSYLLPVAQDYKRIRDNDEGPNTGGMGSYAPIELPKPLMGLITERMINPTLRVLKARGIDYRGVLFAGLMMTAEGPMLLEYNIRFGDPETQSIMPLFKNDFGQLLKEAADGQLESEPEYHDLACVTVVLAAEGYPENPRKGDVITGISEAEALPDITVLYAGVARNEAGELVTNGGRVLNVVATAATVAEARAKAYQAAELIKFDGVQYRSDIATGIDKT
jgi:phosphoribosylamine---glycine ligase